MYNAYGEFLAFTTSMRMVGFPMELRVLEYFLALVREGSVSAAAHALHISQPTLSRQLIDLEDELGTTLFERGRHGITLTEDGLLLRRRAAEIVDLVRTTENEVMLNRGEVAGEIRIGCAETRAMDLLAGVMRRLHEEHPQVTYRIVSAVAEDVVERINRGLLDFGLLLRLDGSDGLHSLELPSNERVGLIVPEGSELARCGLLAPKELVGLPLLLPASYREMGLLGAELTSTGADALDVVATFGLSFNASRMVRAGLGYAVSLEGLVDVSKGSGLAFVPLDVELHMPSYFVWKPFQLRTRACEAFLGRIREIA